MVFSGFVMAWRFAIWPTSRSPFSVNPTTDGVVRFPSALAMTTGSPPDMMATQEFVVPRSIPITLPMSFSFPSPLNHERPNNQPLGRRFHRRVPAFVRTARGDRHYRWPQHAVMQVVTLFVFFHDRIRCPSLGVHRRHCLVHGRIKGLPHAGDRPDTETGQDLQVLLARQLHALDQAVGAARLLSVPECPLQVVQHGKQLPQEALVGVLRVLRLVLLRPFLVVLEFRGQPEIPVLDGLDLLFQGQSLLFAGAGGRLCRLGDRGIGVRRGLLGTRLRLIECTEPACFFYRIVLFSHSKYSRCFTLAITCR